jgi:hypothetical protein
MQEAARAKLIHTIKLFESLEHQLSDQARKEVTASEFGVLAEQIGQASEQLEGLVPPFDRAHFRCPLPPQFNLYDKDRIKRWLTTTLAGLRAAAEAPASPRLPLTSIRELDFSFLVNPDLKRIVLRDCKEIDSGLVNENWKSVIILSGGVMESLLADVLRRVVDGLPPEKAKPNLGKARLFDLINIAHDCGLVGDKVKQLSHTLREYRNLVHAGAELGDKGLCVNAEEADLATVILRIVHRDLAAARR